ncbi:FG-GAP-like repeat-containing protein [Chitinophaga sp. S165]|uniref:FG-GAP-like repeat-containing protein n=1 Tax=Chitinophaga sp. S165 TaxID=2135462 RepID=UPI000D928B84|nr:FG-GAP-like repeat-containing protein [Chitinophaga sp. S165]PWV56881.1 putative secreted protein (Por secretion system target) [Chitinophaga sp. S165]
MKTLLFFASLFPSYLSVAKTTDPVIEKAKLESIKKVITRSEYFIRWQNTAAAYQSPNRNNNLDATYTGQQMSVVPAGSNTDWSFGLTVQNITADGKQIGSLVKDPLISLNDNTIRFNHNGKFTVEYSNSEQGIRQNFIIQQPSSATRKISVQLDVSEGWIAEKHSNTSLLFKNGKQQLSYSGLAVWDAKGNCLPAYFSLVDDRIRIEVDVQHATYPVTIDPLLANSTPQNANSFLQSNRPEALLGWSVSGAGDLNNDGYDDVIVGVPRYKNGQEEEGAAFIYYSSSNGINPNVYTILESNIEHAQFGYTVVAAGDINGDGSPDIVIGAPQYDQAPLSGFRGRFYVYKGTPVGLTTTPSEIIDGSTDNAFLGEVLSAAGDVNGDGYDDIIAGEYYAINQYGDPGIVWIYYGSPFGLNGMAPTMLEGSVHNGTFGRSASGAGDVNGDGYDDIILGSIHALGPLPFQGNVQIYYGSIYGIDMNPNVVLNGHTENFGYKVASAGDINHDGFDDVLVSAPRFFLPFGDTVFVYHGSGNGVDAIPEAALPSPQDNVGYGASIAGAGDLNADGFADIVIGSWLESNGQSMEGTAYVHYGRAIGLNPIPGATIQSNQVNANLGTGVACAGDVNHDGFDDLIVGAPNYAVPAAQVREGGAFIYHGISVNPGLTAGNLAAESLLPSTASAIATVKAFPNPVVDNLSIQFDGLDTKHNTTIQLLNTQGATVKNISVGKIKGGSEQINIDELTPGLYLMIVQNGTNTFREKIIKQ